MKFYPEQPRFLVLDHMDIKNLSDDPSDYFGDFNKAKDASVEQAQRSLGSQVHIYELVAVTTIPVGDPETHHKYAKTHYVNSSK